jgi:anthranilate synthase/aminodeoxychorismate synthase-like glutamine amidotransferase
MSQTGPLYPGCLAGGGPKLEEELSRPGGTLTGVARILVVDNYDSFVYNLVQYLGQLGAEPLVYRNDAITVAEASALDPDGLLISPGPGRPEESGVSRELIVALGEQVPVLGVCLGHQCIGEVFGGQVVRHGVVHGKTSEVTHDGEGVFAGLPNPVVATRYHSLVVDARNVPSVLEVSAHAEDGTIMGLRHRELPVEGVQFHPESILTDGGHRLMANWLASCGQPEALEAVPAAARSLRAP